MLTNAEATSATLAPLAPQNGYRASMRRLAGVLVTLVLLSACGNDGDTESTQADELPKVSTATTCGQLFDGDAPLEAVVDLMSKESTVVQDADEARGLADDLEPIAEQAGEDTEPHIGVVRDELETFAESVDERESFDTTALVTSLTELNNVCGVTPRF